MLHEPGLTDQPCTGPENAQRIRSAFNALERDFEAIRSVHGDASALHDDTAARILAAVLLAVCAAAVTWLVSLGKS